MDYKNRRFSLLITLCILLYQQHSIAQIVMSNSVIGNGGAKITNSDYHMIGTVGQPIIGVIKSSSDINMIGFWYVTGGIVTSVEQSYKRIPTEFRLDQNFPNPFNTKTVICFSLPKRSSVILKLFNSLGREVMILTNEDLLPGEYRIVLDASGLSSGLYFYRLETEKFVQSKKLILMK